MNPCPSYPEGSMKGTKMKPFAAAAALGVLATIALGASTASADKCTGTKIKAIGKKESGLLSCSAKEATKGIAAVEPGCDNKAMSKFQPAYDKPGPCGNPSSSVCELIADDCQTKVRMALPDGDGTNPSVCESKRLKAAGKKASGKLKCYAKAAAKGQPVDSAPGGCLDKASTKFMTAFNAQSGCTGDGNETSIETLIDNECVNQLVTVDGMGHVTGICPTGATTTTTTGAATTTTTSVTTTTTTSTTTSSTTTTTTTSTTTTTTPTCANGGIACGSSCGAGCVCIAPTGCSAQFHCPTGAPVCTGQPLTVHDCATDADCPAGMACFTSGGASNCGVPGQTFCEPICPE